MLAAVIGLFVVSDGWRRRSCSTNLLGHRDGHQHRAAALRGFFIAFAIKAPLWPVPHLAARRGR
jgi:NADH:ubiquinone oxidoreductase subunit 4 (subunit M)